MISMSAIRMLAITVIRSESVYSHTETAMYM